MQRFFATSKSHSDSRVPLWDRRAVREFCAAVGLLSLALFLALASESAMRRGDTSTGLTLAVLSLVLAAIISLTIVPRLARRANLSRWLIPFSFSITREGGLYILAIFLLSLTAINTGNNLLFLILAALLSAMITSGIVSRASLRSVGVSVQVPENVFEGERVSLKVSLRNQKRLFPSFSISVAQKDRLGAGLISSAFQKFAARGSSPQAEDSFTSRSVLRQPAYFPVVLPGEVRSELVAQSFPRRGQYRLEGFHISTRFPFGFFRRGERITAEGEVVVYPSIREISSYYHLLPFLPGILEGRHLGQGESLYAIRRYQDGESARIVDWKATAKTGELMARDFARQEESKFCLILDTLIHPPRKPDYLSEFEKAVSLGASLAAHFCEEGAELELLTPNEYIPKGMGTAHLYRILKSLAVVQCELPSATTSSDLRGELSGMLEPYDLQQILSDKIFKIIISSKPRASFPSSIWRSSHVVYFDEL